MIASLLIASYLTFIHDSLDILPMEPWLKIVIGALFTTVVWITATFFTPPTEDDTLRKFYRLIEPGGNGWDRVIEKANAEGDPIEKNVGQLPLEIFAMILGCVAVYGALFSTGFFIYGQFVPATITTVITAGATFGILNIWPKLSFR